MVVKSQVSEYDVERAVALYFENGGADLAPIPPVSIPVSEPDLETVGIPLSVPLSQQVSLSEQVSVHASTSPHVSVANSTRGAEIPVISSSSPIVIADSDEEMSIDEDHRSTSLGKLNLDMCLD